MHKIYEDRISGRELWQRDEGNEFTYYIRKCAGNWEMAVLNDVARDLEDAREAALNGITNN